MLCRVADSLFWMSRYIERAENIVRLVDVSLLTLLESEAGHEEMEFHHWESILSSLGDRQVFQQAYETHDSRSATEFLIFSRENQSSVYSCIVAARENARMIRDQISSEMWEVINKLFLYLKNTDADAVCNESNFDFFLRIKEFTILFQGITESTFPHQLGYEFIICGRQIERAGKTCQILDTKRFMKTLDDAMTDSLDDAQWAALLKGCSAFEAYHRVFVSDIQEANVLKFLILSRDFPRSVLFCIQRLQKALHAISQCPTTHYSNEAERLTGMLISRLTYLTDDELAGVDAARLIQQIQEQLDQIAINISQCYMFSKIIDPATEVVES